MPTTEELTKFADMLAALGTAPRLRILRLLLAAHPEGLVAGEITEALGVAPSTLSHHLERLKHEGLLKVRREGTFLRYSADAEALQELLSFLLAECCTRNRAVPAETILEVCRPVPGQKKRRGMQDESKKVLSCS